ncbi:MAG: hypothetical protein FJX76_19560 [Armatimonadetes bacterium]|nr:hypothetical protein [Armatimonadota bacterium]
MGGLDVLQDFVLVEVVLAGPVVELVVELGNQLGLVVVREDRKGGRLVGPLAAHFHDQAVAFRILAQVDDFRGDRFRLVVVGADAAELGGHDALVPAFGGHRVHDLVILTDDFVHAFVFQAGQQRRDVPCLRGLVERAGAQPRLEHALVTHEGMHLGAHDADALGKCAHLVGDGFILRRGHLDALGQGKHRRDGLSNCRLRLGNRFIERLGRRLVVFWRRRRRPQWRGKWPWLRLHGG